MFKKKNYKTNRVFLKIQDNIDLHECNRSEVYYKTSGFIRKCKQKSYLKVKIATGNPREHEIFTPLIEEILRREKADFDIFQGEIIVYLDQ